MSKASTIKTWDGITISYTQSGNPAAPNLLFIPGWSQTAEEWRKQITHFSKSYHVTTYDHRSQGESEKTHRGLRISRLAADLNDLITQLNLKDITVVSHSMGCSVTWCYWDLFSDSRKRISKLVLVDQSACMMANPAWSPEQVVELSAVFTSEAIYGIINGMKGPEGKMAAKGLLEKLFTPEVDQKEFEWVLEQNFKMSVEDASTLILDHSTNDWRDVLPTINVPVLVIGGKGSLFTYQGIEHIASQIPGAKCRIFEQEEKGSHFMFFENPDLFNSVLEEFLRGK